MISYGIDIGTTTTRASALDVTIHPFGRKTFSPVGAPLCIFTPFTGNELDEGEISRALEDWRRKEGIPNPDIGTLLFTGEAQRAPNATSLAENLCERWKGLLSAQIDPDIETRLAAQGAKAVEFSARNPGRPVLHLDIGGGTTNLAWIESGKIADTACLDLGCRKWIVDPTGNILKRRKAGERLEAFHPDVLRGSGQFDEKSALSFARVIASRMCDFSAVYTGHDFVVVPWKKEKRGSEKPLLSVSGGVVDCGSSLDFRFGDIGPFIAAAMWERGDVHRSEESGRATALGISAFGFEVSGNSIHAPKPQELHGIPLFFGVAAISEKTLFSTVGIVLRDLPFDSVGIETLANTILGTLRQKGLTSKHTVVLLLRENLAKTLGYYLSQSGEGTPSFLVLDEIPVEEATLSSIDVRPLPSGDRYSVTLKSLKLF